MQLIYQLEDVPDDIPTHLQIADNLLSELHELRTIFGEAVTQAQLKAREFHTVKGKFTPVASFTNLAGPYADPRLASTFKSFFFILRQCQASLMHLAFLYQPILATRKGGRQICDGGNEDRFKDFAEGVRHRRFDYAPEALELFDKHLDVLIKARALRNALKSQPYFNVIITNDAPMIHVRVRKRTRDDPTLKLLRVGFSCPIEELQVLNIAPAFVDMAFQSCVEIFQFFVAREPGQDKNPPA